MADPDVPGWGTVDARRARLLDALEELAVTYMDVGPDALVGFKALGLVMAQVELERPGALDRAKERMDTSPATEARRRKQRMEERDG